MKATATFALAALLVLAGCGGAKHTALTATNATTTSAPKSTSTPTAAADVASLKAAGLPVGESFTFDAQNDQNHSLGRPNQYIGKTNWVDTTVQNVTDHGVDISTDDGGSIEVFGDTADAQSRYNYVTAIVKSAGSLASEYDFLHGETLLRVSGSVTPDQAAAYNAALSKALA